MHERGNFVKKVLCVLLSMLMLVTLFVGCGNTANTETTTEGTTMAQEDNYTPDSVLRILMVGNSFCYYYTDELYELLMENPPEGITEVEIYNLYYSGCNLTQHYTWWMKNESNYDLFKVSANGRENLNNVHTKWSLEQALAWSQWDYISLQGSVVNGSYMNVQKRELTRNGIAETAELGGGEILLLSLEYDELKNLDLQIAQGAADITVIYTEREE